MITEITITNKSNANTATFGSDYSADEYIFTNIDGIGPVKANIAMSNYVTDDGSVFQNARAEYRNIVLSVMLNPNYAVDSDPYGTLRRALYPVMSPKSEVLIVIKNSDPSITDLYTYGWVESFEPDIFSKDPTIKLSIICPDSYFSGDPSWVADGHSVPLASTLDINYPGTVETGYTLIIDGISTLNTPLYIFNYTTQQTPMAYYGSLNLISGELLVLYISTVRGFREAWWKVSDYYLENGSGSAILGTPTVINGKPSVQGGWTPVPGYISNWGTLSPGWNTLYLEYGDGTMPLDGPAQIDIYASPKYLGV